MIRRPPRSTLRWSSAASDVYKRQWLHSMCQLPEPHPRSRSQMLYTPRQLWTHRFVLLITDGDHPDGRVTLYHRLQRYEPRLGRPTPFDGSGYAFYGDVVQGQAPPSIEWPANAFHQVNAAVRIPTRPVLEDWLVANPDTPLVDPPDALGLDTEIVRVRNCMLVPFRYVHLLLQRPLTP